MEKCKFLVSGDVKGRFKLLFSKVEKSIKKCGPFAFLLCTGSFFDEKEKSGADWNEYILKPENIPIHVYILGPNSEAEAKFYNSFLKTSNINEKITFVGKSGVFTTCEGIKVAYISGLESLNAFLSITEVDIKNCSMKEGTVDIIFTSQWPIQITDSGITDYKPDCPSELIFNLIKTLKPRYCFSGFEDKFYERLPLCHVGQDGSVEFITRFVGLAFVGNPKEKWLYAVNMELQRKLSKFDANKISMYLKYQPQDQQCVSDIPLENIKPKIKEKKCKTKTNFPKKLNIEGNCWFCLSSEEPQNHLVIAVGMKVYLALCKGGLVQDHMCLIPIDHVSSVFQASIDIRKELHFFKNFLKAHYKKNKEDLIFYERFYRTSHAHVNCIPMREDLACNVKSSFMERAAEIGVNLMVFSSEEEVFMQILPGDEYFLVELADGEELFCKILPESDFSLDFGREALVNRRVLNSPEKASWKKCVLNPEDEKWIVKKLRSELHFNFKN